MANEGADLPGETSNILFIHTDEQRADTLGCYGNELIETPHLDRLAQEGVTFHEGHCTHPLCTPSRGSLLTGRYPSAHGSWRNGIPIQPAETTIAELLRQAGYQTGLFGKAHFTPFHGDPETHPESRLTSQMDADRVWDFWDRFDGPYYGFETLEMVTQHGHKERNGGHYGRWIQREHPAVYPLFEQSEALEPTDVAYNSWKSALPLETHSSRWVADRTIEFIEANAGDEPFFGWVGFPDPHFPYNPPEPYCNHYDPGAIELPVDPDGEVWEDRNAPRFVEYHLAEKYGIDWRTIPEAKQREIIAHYYAMIDLIDDEVGRILDSLEEHGVAEETVVVFTSDHGDWLGDHGLFQKGIPHTRELTRIPWIIRWPEVATTGLEVTEPTSHVDLVPTLLDAAGVTIPYGVQGESLRPVLNGQTNALRPFALVEHRHEPYRQDSALVQQLGDDDVEELSARDSLINWTDEPIHVDTVYAHDHRLSFITGTEGSYHELFDHQSDPEEWQNLWLEDETTWAELLEVLVRAELHAKDPLPERTQPV